MEIDRERAETVYEVPVSDDDLERTRETVATQAARFRAYLGAVSEPPGRGWLVDVA